MYDARGGLQFARVEPPGSSSTAVLADTGSPQPQCACQLHAQPARSFRQSNGPPLLRLVVHKPAS